MTRLSFALWASAALLLVLTATSTASSVRRWNEGSAPLPLLPDYMQHAKQLAAPRTSRALVTVPRESLSTCVNDLKAGLFDSFSIVFYVTEVCHSAQIEQLNTVVEDILRVYGDASADVRKALSECQSGVRSSCVPLLLGVAVRHTKPIALVAAETFLFVVQKTTLGWPELFGCIFLPGIVPALWNTFLDMIIFAQCLAH